MGIPFMIFLAAAGMIVAFVVVSYNRLVSPTQRSKSAWSDVDVQLKRRTDLVPNRAILAAALLTALARSAGAHQRLFAIDRFAVTLEVGVAATLRVREGITRRDLGFSVRVDDIHVFGENAALLRTKASRPGILEMARGQLLTTGRLRHINTACLLSVSGSGDRAGLERPDPMRGAGGEGSSCVYRV